MRTVDVEVSDLRTKVLDPTPADEIWSKRSAITRDWSKFFGRDEVGAVTELEAGG